MVGLGFPELVLILLVALAARAVCALVVVTAVLLLVRPQMRPAPSADDRRGP